ncbi:thiol:disulfide interchange protein DsbC [Salmonella enterica subsp. enterica serovar Choleraesuis]|nr:thiol:disulfide interchange protein DsbC [Salmonella enterica subsp. enterica serovar Choleraesuis]
MNKRIFLLTLLASSFAGMAHADDATIRQSLMKLGVHDAEIQPSPVAGMKTVLTDSGALYVTEDGKHILQGPMYDVSGAQPVNVTNAILMKKLNALTDQMIVYKAAKEQYVVTVFTDITCGYCHKLHEQMKDYNALGITIRYLAFPRQGLQSEAEQNMQSIWCSKDPRHSFDLAMTGSNNLAAATCNVDIKKHYSLGVQFGIQGTPALVLNDGMVIPGYQSPKELKEFLDKHRASAK